MATLPYASNPAIFNRRVLIFREVVTQDEYGSPLSSWHPFKETMASIEPLRGREYWQAAQTQSESTVRILVRFFEGLTGRFRVQYDSPNGVVIYSSKSPPINYQEKNQYLELMVTEEGVNESV